MKDPKFYINHLFDALALNIVNMYLEISESIIFSDETMYNVDASNVYIFG